VVDADGHARDLAQRGRRVVDVNREPVTETIAGVELDEHLEMIGAVGKTPRIPRQLERSEIVRGDA